MGRSSSGTSSMGMGVFGLIGLLIVVAVVLYLSAQSFRTSVPILTGPGTGDPGPAGSEDSVGVDPQTQRVRGLDHMKKKTNEYTSQVNDAMGQLNDTLENKPHNP